VAAKRTAREVDEGPCASLPRAATSAIHEVTVPVGTVVDQPWHQSLRSYVPRGSGARVRPRHGNGGSGLDQRRGALLGACAEPTPAAAPAVTARHTLLRIRRLDAFVPFHTLGIGGS